MRGRDLPRPAASALLFLKSSGDSLHIGTLELESHVSTGHINALGFGGETLERSLVIACQNLA